jgi:CheY-like chemotaxis protein
MGMHGHETRVVYTGREAVAAAHAFGPDVVLCDLGLPGLDGCGVARQLRDDPRTAAVRLIAMTAYDSPEARRRSADAGFEKHLAKPVSPTELLALLSLSA